MITYNDLLSVGSSERERIELILKAIREHQSSEAYRTAVDAVEYEAQRNTTIRRYQKILRRLSGEAVPDMFSANHKCASNFFYRFVTQEAAFLLGNGVTFKEDSTKDKLGKDFDNRIYDAGKTALVQGQAFGFFNKDRVLVFGLTQFVPLYDEENGALMAGIRFWRVDQSSPLRVTLYEVDGYTEYKEMGERSELNIWREKKPYILKIASTKADGDVIYDGRNYPTLPIVPIWGNRHKQSELVGLRENIDCYDLIKSGFANDLDEAASIYWIIKNTGGLEDDVDIRKFLEQLHMVKGTVVNGDGNVDVSAHTVEVPHESREVYLTRLESDMYNDFMAVNPAPIAAGNITATQIMAAYEPLNNKVDEFEYYVRDFITGILAVAEIDDEPEFKRSPITNLLEQTEMILMAADHLDDETIIRSLPFLTPEQADAVIERRIAEEGGLNRRGINTLGDGETPENNAVEPDTGI